MDKILHIVIIWGVSLIVPIRPAHAGADPERPTDRVIDLLREERYVEARAAIDSLEKSSPGDPAVPLLRKYSTRLETAPDEGSRQVVMMELLAASMKEFTQQLEGLDQSLGQLNESLGQLEKSNQGLREQMEKEYPRARAAALEKPGVTTWMRVASLALGTSRYPEAVSAARQALEFEPGNVEAARVIKHFEGIEPGREAAADAAYQKEKQEAFGKDLEQETRASLPGLERRSRENPTPETLMALAEALITLKEHAAAVAPLSRVLEIDPSHATAGALLELIRQRTPENELMNDLGISRVRMDAAMKKLEAR